MWNSYWSGRPRRNVPQVNYNQDSSEEDYDSPLQSPNRPPPTRAGSPVELAIPTLGDNVDEELESVAQTLNNVGRTHMFRNTRPAVPDRPDPEGGEQPQLEVHPLGSEEVINEGFINQVPVEELGAEAPPNNLVAMANYDQENGVDDDNAFSNARDVKLPFNKHDIRLWFSLIESKMQFAGIKKQWSKRQVLIQLIPAEYHNDFKQYLIQQQADAGDQAYYVLKQAMLKQFGPKQADGFDKAIARVMTGTPAQLGRQIVNDICPGIRPMSGCHCAQIVLGIWRRSLPSVVRNQIADMEFSAATYEAVFDKADSVWSANAANTSVVSALSKDKEVAASSFRGGRGGRGGGRGQPSGTRGGGQNRGGGQGGGAQGGQSGRGPRHPDNPPQNSCKLHWKFGKAAWRCGDRHSCPWRDFESPKPRHNRNIVAETDVEIVD